MAAAKKRFRAATDPDSDGLSHLLGGEEDLLVQFLIVNTRCGGAFTSAYLRRKRGTERENRGEAAGWFKLSGGGKFRKA